MNESFCRHMHQKSSALDHLELIAQAARVAALTDAEIVVADNVSDDGTSASLRGSDRCCNSNQKSRDPRSSPRRQGIGNVCTRIGAMKSWHGNKSTLYKKHQCFQCLDKGYYEGARTNAVQLIQLGR